MTREKNFENVTQKALERILNGKFETKIFDELVGMDEFIKGNAYAREYQNFFSMLNLSECKKLKTSLRKEMFRCLKEENLSYLQTARVIRAFDALGYDIFNKFPTYGNKRVQFCLELIKKDCDFPFDVVAILD